MVIEPALYHSTVDKVTEALTQQGWQVTPFGYEWLPEETKSAIQSNYNITNLYIRTRPDLLVVRDGFHETYLIEAKDLTEIGKKTGNASIEALPWFTAQHLRKMNIRYLYAIEADDAQVYIIKPEAKPFSEISIILLPRLHEKTFRQEVLSGLKKVFPKKVFSIIKTEPKFGSSNDPFILVSYNIIKQSGRPLEFFALWGWK